MPESSESELSRLRKENEELRKTLTTLSSQLSESLAGNRDLREQMKDLQQKLDILIVQFKKRNRKDFGPKTEKRNPQKALDQPTPPKKPPAKKNDSGADDGQSRKHIHRHNVPTEPVKHPVSEQDLICPECQVETKSVGTKLSYQLDKIVNTLRKLEHQQEVRACQSCKHYIVTAEKPDEARGQYTPALRADIIVGKFGDGLPHTRQEKRFAREKATVPKSTQSDCSIDSAMTLEPLYDLLNREIRKSKVIKTDDSEIKIQDRSLKGRMRKGKMTVYVALALTAFDFSPDQSFQRNIAWLKDFTGYVQADAARGFDALYRDGTKIEVGCSAHSRRRYFECLPLSAVECNRILNIYERLYDVERDFRDKPAAERLAARRKKSKPIVKNLRKAILSLKDALNPTHPLLAAIEYTLNHWIALTKFLKDPDLDIDNNEAERAIKAFVLMRKNSLFVGSDAGGKAAAIHLSFLASCKQNKIDPVAYLTDVFTRINSMKTSELAQLLPDRWAQARKESNTQANSSENNLSKKPSMR
jgi:transposase